LFCISYRLYFVVVLFHLLKRGKTYFLLFFQLSVLITSSTVHQSSNLSINACFCTFLDQWSALCASRICSICRRFFFICKCLDKYFINVTYWAFRLLALVSVNVVRCDCKTVCNTQNALNVTRNVLSIIVSFLLSLL